MNDVVNLITNLGFPIVCCGYMMITNNKTLRENTEATNKLVILIEKLVSMHDKGGGVNE